MVVTCVELFRVLESNYLFFIWDFISCHLVAICWAFINNITLNVAYCFIKSTCSIGDMRGVVCSVIKDDAAYKIFGHGISGMLKSHNTDFFNLS